MTKSKRLLITGSSGFIGRNIARQALSEGYEVIGMDIKPNKTKGIKFIKGDVRDKAIVEKASRNVEYIIHLAAITSNLEFESDFRKCYDINVNGFLNVIDVAHNNGCKKFLYASSSAVYLDKFSENTVIDISKRNNHYAKSKLINEMLASSYHNLYGLPIVGMRFFNNYGPEENEKGNYASIPTIFLKYKKEGKTIRIYGDGRQARDMIYVTDTAKIALKLLRKSVHPIYNIGTGIATSYNSIANMFKQEKEYVKNPLSAYQLLTKADTSRLIRTIGNYKFVSIEEGIKKLAKYYKVKL